MAEHGVDIVIRARDEASEKLGNIQRNFTLLARGFTAATALRMGSFIAVDLYRAWGVEQAKVSGNYTNILENEIKLNEALLSTARAIPVIGRGVAFAMEAFGENEGLRNSLKLVEQMRDVTAAAAKEAKNWSFNAKIMGATAAGRPPSEIAAMQAAQAQGGRQEEIDALKQKIADAQKALAEQVKKEDTAALVKNLAMSTSVAGLLVRSIHGPALPNRSGSESMREKIPGMQSELANLGKGAVETAASDELRLAKMRADERNKIDKADTENAYKLAELKNSLLSNEVERAKAAVELKYQKEIDAARKAGTHLIEIDEMRKIELAKIDQDVAIKRADFEKTQRQKIEDMSLDFIKNKTEKETATINLKYDREIQKAKELGMSTDLLEVQRQIALKQAGQSSSSHRGVNMTEVRFDERNMFRYGNGAGGPAIDPTQKAVAVAEKQLTQGQESTKLLRELVNLVRYPKNSSGTSLTPSSFY